MSDEIIAYWYNISQWKAFQCLQTDNTQFSSTLSLIRTVHNIWRKEEKNLEASIRMVEWLPIDHVLHSKCI